MADVERLSFSLEKKLARKLGRLVKSSGYKNRSEFIRDLIRERLVEKEWESDRETLGTVTVVFNHDRRDTGRKLTQLQHKRHTNVLVSTHLHLDHNLCAEIIAVKGKPGVIEDFAGEIRKQKGVLHASLSVSSTGKELG